MALKSSWELALERTGGKSTAKLSNEQKTKLAELDKVYTAKIAERELELKPKIAAANAAGKGDEAQKLDDILRNEVAKLRAKLESEKEKVRQGK
jgi:hypothetical protein